MSLSHSRPFFTIIAKSVRFPFREQSAALLEPRLRAVSYISLQSYCKGNPSMRAAKPRAAINEGVTPRRKNKKNQTDFKRKGGLQAQSPTIGRNRRFWSVCVTLFLGGSRNLYDLQIFVLITSLPLSLEVFLCFYFLRLCSMRLQSSGLLSGSLRSGFECHSTRCGTE